MKFLLLMLLPISSFAQSPYQIRNVYSVNPVTTSAWVQLIASTSVVANKVAIFDSCGQTMQLGFGAAGSEVQNLIIPPGGGGFPLNIPAGTRISLRAISATCNAASTEFDMNLF